MVVLAGAEDMLNTTDHHHENAIKNYTPMAKFTPVILRHQQVVLNQKTQLGKNADLFIRKKIGIQLLALILATIPLTKTSYYTMDLL